MRRKLLIGVAIIFGVFALVAGRSLVHAQSFKTGGDITVSSNETVDSTLYSFGRTIDIAGKVNGDVYCAGQTITVSGTVTGDVICAGQTITISGSIEGNVRLAGQTISLNGQIGHNATVAGQTIETSQSSKINSDALLGGTDVTLNGPIGRDVVAGVNHLTIAGSIGRNLRAQVNTLHFNSNASVAGTVNYTSNNDAVIDSGAQVSNIQRTTPKQHNNVKNWTVLRFAFLFNIIAMIALLILSLGLVLLWPGVFQTSSNRALEKPWRTLLIGVIGVFVAPIVFITLMITVVGIPLALLFGLVWLLVLFLSGPLFSYWLGRLVWRNGHNVILTMLTGVLIVMVVYVLPFLGILMGLAVLFMGTGIVLSTILAHYRKPNYHIPKTVTSRTSKNLQ